eukprot:SAG11_NODE_634_length_8046_cov_8.096011_3_plen_50_part_00
MMEKCVPFASHAVVIRVHVRTLERANTSSPKGTSYYLHSDVECEYKLAP